MGVIRLITGHDRMGKAEESDWVTSDYDKLIIDHQSQTNKQTDR